MAVAVAVAVVVKGSVSPPPEPNWSEAISSPPSTWPTKRVAPTAVTHGEEAGHEAQSTGALDLVAKPEKVVSLAAVWESTVL